jgi:2-polyprenyl-3-methyl-5-hydroxy-6-metoxy-1,4-benzoquinol methylase
VGRALEVGSLNVNGTIREVFQHRAADYIGVDIMAGDCVDFVVDGERLTDNFPTEHFDTVLCFECLEHTVRPWIVVEQMRKVLKPGGHLWVSTPTYGFPLHRFPVDCYRFGEDAYRLWLFDRMELLRLEHVVDDLDQPAIVAVGGK